MNATASAATHPGGWQAKLALGFERRQTRTVLAHRTQRGPLAVQRPFYPENDVCHLYVLHPPGGVVGGDSLSINVDCAEQSSTLITTPGATKFYRSNGLQAEQHQELSVAEGAALEWLPQENIFFPGAIADLRTRIVLADQAQFFGWEIHSLGRPANEENFDAGRVGLALEVWRDSIPLLVDRFSVDEHNSVHRVTGLRGNPVIGTLLATDANASHLAQIRDSDAFSGDARAAATLLDNLLVVRYLGRNVEQAQQLFRSIWSQLREPLINRPACPPRIWST